MVLSSGGRTTKQQQGAINSAFSIRFPVGNLLFVNSEEGKHSQCPVKCTGSGRWEWGRDSRNSKNEKGLK